MSAARIPKTAPFAEEDIAILNGVVGSASPTQRAWLSGFLAGLDAANDQTQPSAPPRPAEPLTILFASESGNAERLASDVAKAARRRGFRPSIVDMADLEVASLAQARRLVVIAATWGEGDPPSRAARAFADLLGERAPRLDGVEYGVLALGDTAYPEFCATGRRIDDRLAALGATRVLERVDCDLDYARPAAAWVEEALAGLAPREAARGGSVISVDFGARHEPAAENEPDLGPVMAEVSEHINLNSSRSDKETIHLELRFDEHAPAYEPGDSLTVLPENDPAAVNEVLTAAGLSAEEGLRGELLRGRDITTLSLRTLEAFVAATGHAGAKSLVASGDGRSWIAGRQLIDLLSEFPADLSAEQLRSFTRPLAARAYSIASSRREVGDEAHLLVSAVRYESHGRARSGVASTFLADRVRKGAQLEVKLQANRHFRLPEGHRDIVMVGPGTGIAPFRAFLQERRARGASGRNWLFFGDRRFTHDFLYQLEWQEALKEGALTRMDLAFSRDAPRKVYVQDRLWERRRDLVDWLEKGANFYVCGDAKAMAKDVRSTLVRAYGDVRALSPEAAEEAVASLETSKRYLQDVY